MNFRTVTVAALFCGFALTTAQSADDGAPACIRDQMAAAGEDLVAAFSLICGDTLVTSSCSSDEIAQIDDEKKICDVLAPVVANQLCPTENALKPDVVTPEIFACKGACCAEIIHHGEPVSDTCKTELQVAHSQGKDLCDAVDAESGSVCSTSGGTWAVDQDKSNKKCSDVADETTESMVVMAAFASLASDSSSSSGGEALDLNYAFSMISATKRAEVGEACCDGYVAAEMMCTADDLPVFVSSPPPRPPCLPPQQAVFANRLPTAHVVVMGGPADEHRAGARGRTGWYDESVVDRMHDVHRERRR